MTCLAASVGSVITGAGGSLCSIRIEGDAALVASGTVSVGTGLKAGGSAGIGAGYTNARTMEEIGALTWNAELECTYPVGWVRHIWLGGRSQW